MAVVDNVSTTQHCRKDYELTINQIKEITGADIDEAWTVLKEASFDIHEAIQILSEQTRRGLAKKPRTQSNLSTQSTSTQTTFKERNNVIDLTEEQDNVEQDIEKAIALSLQEAQEANISNEQRDINRALEASFKDSKCGTKRTRTDFWQSVVDSNPHDNKRSGSYPVGLRNVGNTCWFSAVVQSLFHIPAFRKIILEFPEDEGEGDQKVVTVKELQKLFALMIGSKKKYIDPSNVIQSLTDFFKEDMNQQDVSEFMTKLLDYLEGTFKSKQQTECRKSRNVEAVNPVVEMFYGQYTVEGMSAGKRFTKEETFGAYPLQIENYGNLSECIQAGMVHNDIEPAEQANEETYTKGHWFTRLPAVLVLELSRFRFNQQSQQPEKIHSKLEFEENMYIDWYMQENQDKIRQLREEMYKLKAEPFLTERTEELPAADRECEELTFGRESPEAMEISGNEESPADIKCNVDTWFKTEDLRKVLYRLHAVLVHEGEANGGHYWAFIYDTRGKIWRKFNDITVRDVTWEDVRLGSFGGSLDASAYCLIYTDSEKSSELFDDNDCHFVEKLKKLVEEDNSKFEAELREWDKKKISIVKEEKDAETLQDITMEAEDTVPQNEFSQQKKNHRLIDPSKILNDVTNMVSHAIDKHDVGYAFKEWYEKEREMLRKRATENLSSTEKCQSDVRLEHKTIYMIRCGAPAHVADRAILETFLEGAGEKTCGGHMQKIYGEAKKKLEIERRPGELDEYKTWKEHYSTFLKANLAFINGLEYFQNHKYHESLSYLTYAVKLNSQLPQNGQFNKDLLSRAVGLCLLRISEKAFVMFSSGSNEDVFEALNVMNEQVIPYMNMSDCCKVVEHIREQWLTPCLGKTREDRIQQSVEDFLHHLFEGNISCPVSEQPLLMCELDCKILTRKFSTIMELINNSTIFSELANIR